MGKGQAVMGGPLAGSAPRAEISAGYKRTEVGVIPEGWKLGSFSDFGVFRSGSGFPLIYQGLLSGDYPFFKVSDMNNQGNGLFMEIANHWISEHVRKKLGVTKHPAGSIIFAKIGAAIFLERKRLLSRESCIDNNMMAFSLTEPHACQQYFYYLFLHLELGKYVSTTALPSLSGHPIGAISIPIPPTDEQCAIAEVLSDVDGLIESLESLITKKRAVKMAAMQQLLTGKTRLPGFIGGWDTKQFGKTFKRLNAKTHQIQTTEYCTHGLHPVIDQGQIPVIAFSDRTDRLFYTPTGGVIVFGDHTRVVKFIDMDFLIGADGLQILGLLTENVTKFFFYQLATKTIPDTGYNRHFKFLKDLVFVVPPLTEQHAITAVLSDMDTEIASLEQRRDKIYALKQGMMQQLLTGRIRLARPL